MDTLDFSSRYRVLKDRIAAACARCGRNPSDIRIVVVTKTHPIETVQALIDAGIRDIGENRVQEIEAKVPHLRGTFDMHLIGHLQSNKVNKAVPLVSWIQSIDSVRLADKVNAAAQACQKRIKALVQVKTSAEETKSGCAPEECARTCGAHRGLREPRIPRPHDHRPAFGPRGRRRARRLPRCARLPDNAGNGAPGPSFPWA